MQQTANNKCMIKHLIARGKAYSNALLDQNLKSEHTKFTIYIHCYTAFWKFRKAFF